MNATIIEVQRTGVNMPHQSVEHTSECPLLRDRREFVDQSIYEAVRFGRKSESIDIVLEAVAICAACRGLYHHYSDDAREETYAHVGQIVSMLGNLLYRRYALQQRRVWYTERIEESLEDLPSLTRLRYERGMWSAVFHAYCEVMQEATDIRYEGPPFVRLADTLLPRTWREEDVLGYISSRVEMDIESIRACLSELARLIKEHEHEAVEPLGWFIADDSGAGYYLIGWRDLLNPDGADVGRQSIRHEQETSSRTVNLPAEEKSHVTDQTAREGSSTPAFV